MQPKTRARKEILLPPVLKIELADAVLDNSNFPHLSHILTSVNSIKTPVLDAPEFEPSKFSEKTKKLGALERIKERMIIILFLILDLFKIKKKERKRKISIKAKKALRQLEELAALYQTNCQTGGELLAFDAAFGQVYYEMLQYSRQNNGNEDPEFYADKMTEFVHLFEY